MFAFPGDVGALRHVKIVSLSYNGEAKPADIFVKCPHRGHLIFSCLSGKFCTIMFLIVAFVCSFREKLPVKLEIE